MDEEGLSLEEHLKILQRERHERKATVLARARAALATAREDIARGAQVDPAVISDLENSIAEYERYTLDRPGLPPEQL
jgi:DnaJ-domain-containing protein 1